MASAVHGSMSGCAEHVRTTTIVLTRTFKVGLSKPGGEGTGDAGDGHALACLQRPRRLDLHRTWVTLQQLHTQDGHVAAQCDIQNLTAT
eukprot:432618-Rhodomonas_salina.2